MVSHIVRFFIIIIAISLLFAMLKGIGVIDNYVFSIPFGLSLPVVFITSAFGLVSFLEWTTILVIKLTRSFFKE